MADRATYILMGTYILLFACLFVGVVGAIAVIVRDQAATERPVAAPMVRRPAATSTAIDDAVTGGTPALAAPPVRLIPTV